MCSKKFLSSPTTKLALYITTASLASLLADLNNYLHATTTVAVDHATSIKWSIIGINFVLQGLIAWRAFIDDASIHTEEDKKKESGTEVIQNKDSVSPDLLIK
jgi:hypothetical protein